MHHSYRSIVSGRGLQSFRVAVKETDLLVRAETVLERQTRDLVLKCRTPLERYIQDRPDFVHLLIPPAEDPLAPSMVQAMIKAGQDAGVGPMAAVAGAVAEYVGKGLLAFSREVIVENGGDIFASTSFPLTIGIFAGPSRLSQRLGIRIDSPRIPRGICTSSGTVGHSLSFGKADAVVVVAPSAALADAAATAIGNVVQDKRAIAEAIRFGERIPGLLGIVIIVGDQLGVWGDVELVKIT